jgi:hypothetical protein
MPASLLATRSLPGWSLTPRAAPPKTDEFCQSFPLGALVTPYLDGVRTRNDSVPGGNRWVLSERGRTLVASPSTGSRSAGEGPSRAATGPSPSGGILQAATVVPAGEARSVGRRCAGTPRPSPGDTGGKPSQGGCPGQGELPRTPALKGQSAWRTPPRAPERLFR